MSNNHTCPNGHPSDSADYCDICGAPIGVGPAASSPGPKSISGTMFSPRIGSGGAGSGQPARPIAQPCPSCSVANAADALFCEACGYDFTTGTMPRAVPPASAFDLNSPGATDPDPLAPPVAVDWVAEVWVDPDWYADQESEEPCPSPGLPVVVPLRTRSLLIGRRSASRNIHPDIECSSDVGVSRRQAQLTTDGHRWWVEDLQSSNGTHVGPASGPLPDDPLRPGQRQELAQHDRIYIGAWTRIVVRRSTPEERAGKA